jgi:gallate dioxygenase
VTPQAAGQRSPFGPAALEGVALYRGEMAQRAFRLNRFLVHISAADRRGGFLADEDGVMRQWELTGEEQELVRRRDYSGLLAYGVNIYAIAKSGHVFGASLLDIGAAMTGQTAQQFLDRRGAAARGT